MYILFKFLGCLFWTVLIVWLFFKLKLYYVVAAGIAGIFLYVLYKYLSTKIKIRTIQKEHNFEPEPGEVYKVCPVCGKDVRRSAEKCPFCGNMF